MNPDRMGPHLRKAHDVDRPEVYGLECPVCGKATETVQGMGSHAITMHGRKNLVDLWVSVEEAGDPDGVVAARRAAVAQGTLV